MRSKLGKYLLLITLMSCSGIEHQSTWRQCEDYCSKKDKVCRAIGGTSTKARAAVLGPALRRVQNRPQFQCHYP